MKERILIVDDEERMRKLIEAYLKKEGYETLQAENGLEALNIFKKEKIHLIILDIMMPIMDGYTVCREIRKTSNVPIIFLTAKGEDEDKLLGFELGTDHYVTKPFNMKILIAKVKSLINRVYNSTPQEKKEYFCDGLYVDELSHKVTLDDENLYLSPKEFDLLIYFMANKGIVLSREKILNAIWGLDFEGDLRTVDSHIKRLREKLGDKAYLISTIRGTGYRFEAKNEE
ncbi:DNA-binding response regulator, OmpR family, contains REC and winged-helix (wHTH) domain [Clostridium sp. USBA 49]|uniref:response regulator transcription factor n=1 Tax=Clostridium TaxID=1485 RepID=UPI00099B22C1|nr:MULTISPECIES: response regulator transcription factor [Clostridium]SKA87815.1 DNA-binding response regulator, OmpR family, contains REC and winged-helix (wHTH) domain [Clostridium sp. USBA 49]